MKKNCCETLKSFDSLYGGIKIALATYRDTMDIEAIHEITHIMEFREVWGFFYCPFCGTKRGKT